MVGLRNFLAFKKKIQKVKKARVQLLRQLPAFWTFKLGEDLPKLFMYLAGQLRGICVDMSHLSATEAITFMLGLYN